MKFYAFWIYIISLFQLRLLDIIRAPTIKHDEESIFNMYGNGKTISEIPFQKSSVMFEAQCLAQCMHNYRCLSFEVFQLTAEKYDCSSFSVLYQATTGLVAKKQGVKYYSKYVQQYDKDCVSWYKAGATKNGVYDIWLLGKYHLQVFCNMEINGGGWMVFQQRLDGSVNFDRTWDEYKNGFGNINGEHWLGNKWLHLITNSSQKYDLLVKVVSFKDEKKMKMFHGFKISSEKEEYKFDYEVVSNQYRSPTLFKNPKGMPFSTTDRDNDKFDKNCAKRFGGGWWYDACHHDLMNGKYPDKDYEEGKFPFAEGIIWKEWEGYYTSMRESQIMIKPSSF